MEENKKLKHIDKNKLMVFIVILFVVIAGLSLASYAFFTSVGSTKKETANLNTGTMILEFLDNDDGIDAKLHLGESVTKKFIIKNKGTLEASLSMDFYKLYNSYSEGSLTYILEYSEEENGEYTEIVSKTNVPVTKVEINHPISTEISVPAESTYYYNLTIAFNDLDKDQTSDVDAEFHTNFIVNQPLKYRYYNLSIDPNGGTWNEYTSTQEYKLKNDDTIEVENPTRVGYTFNGWEITGVSSNITDNTFHMGISDTILKAKWTPNVYNLTVNLDGGHVTNEIPNTLEYGSSIELDIPTKEGYTFLNWEVSNESVLEGNTLTQNIDEDITIKALWQINNYKYIVYHQKQNINGEGYTIVSADTDEGESEYNSTIRPEVKTYTGFTTPEIKPLTIQIENTYPPEKNKVEYNYTRNQYNLTVNLNGGISTEEYPSKLYYEQQLDLGIPEKVGYTFTNWSKTSGEITDNILKMSNANSTVTANYTPKEFTITFNANGGVVETQSKIVEYDSTYGELPIPTNAGQKFLGWFTSQTDGEEIKSTSKVTITEDLTLYAHFTKPLSAITLESLNLTVNSGDPDFSQIADTDEGIFAMEDNYDVSYYFRGAVENNYVKFAGFYWRIIRINGDGTLRIIYDGVTPYANGESDTNGLPVKRIKWHTNKTNASFVKYIGSVAKTEVENWYANNISSEYRSAIADTLFCNDTTAAGYGTNGTIYNTYDRAINFKPTLKCPSGHWYVTNSKVSGTAALTYPVGLITSDESMVAGLVYKKANTNNYLLKYSWYWTMSPQDSGTYSKMFLNSSYLSSNELDSIGGIVPVINLTANYATSLIGTGTITDPFRNE